MQLKLKRNNGYQNLGGFDYEQWLFYKQIGATVQGKSVLMNTGRAMRVTTGDNAQIFKRN